MANEIRVRSNNQAGTITDNPLTNVSATINSAAFVDLPTIDATNHLLLILDPLEVNGPAEIVRVTAHAAASTQVTVVRGAESSSPRQHPTGTTWYHGPATSDFIESLTSSTRPVVPYEGQLIFETDTNVFRQHNGTAWTVPQLDVPSCRITSIAGQTFTTGVEASVVFDDERWDTDSMHSNTVNNTRITFNTPGLYTITGHGSFAANATGNRYLAIRLNNTSYIAVDLRAPVTAVNACDMSIATIWKMAAGDFIELKAFQASGGNLALGKLANYSPELTATYIGKG